MLCHENFLLDLVIILLRDDVYKILVIGPLPIAGDVIGGTKVSFEKLCKLLQNDKDISVTIVNTSRPLKDKPAYIKSFYNVVTLFKVLFSSFLGSFNYFVIIWNVSPTAIPISGPLFWLSTRFGKARIIMRVFGGNFDEVIESKSKLVRFFLYNTIFKFDCIFLQSKFLVKKYKKFNNIVWFPNTRNISSPKDNKSIRCKKFVYLGQLRKEKGIDVIVNASFFLNSDISVTICGPIVDDFDIYTLNCSRVSIVEPINNKDVGKFLSMFDAFLFPTYYQGEGYPGVVIEALQIGLPVVTTNWKAMPEIIEHGKNGMIINPHDTSALIDAINTLSEDRDYYQKLVSGALKRGKFFHSNREIKIIKQVINQYINNH